MKSDKKFTSSTASMSSSITPGRCMGRGRGIGFSNLIPGECLCNRSHCSIICHVCGYLGWGRLRFNCPKHPQTMFLIDISQCPKCSAHTFMMSEF